MNGDDKQPDNTVLRDEQVTSETIADLNKMYRRIKAQRKPAGQGEKPDERQR